jgi:hypothetical protein
MQDVLARLEKLEKQSRRLKRAGALALATVGALVLMGQAPQPRTLEAERFVIRDQQGRVRAELGLYEAPRTPLGRLSPAVKLFDDRGNSRAVLAAYPQGPSLDFYDDAGNIRVELVHVDHHGSDLEISGPPGKGEHAQTPAESEGAVLKIDEGLKTGPVLDIWDRRGFEATLGSVDRYSPRYPTSAASLVLAHRDGEVIWRAP